MEPFRISPKTITTHHVLKVIALVIMTIDHIGAYLYPEMLWWRAIGRITFPVWFFLIGHTPSRPVSRDLILWAVALMVINPFLGAGFFPTNALVTLACCQYALLVIDRKQLLDREPWTLLIASLCLFLPSFVLMEYGTQGFLYALMGYAVRENKMDWKRGKLVTCFALVLFLVVQAHTLEYSTAQILFMCVGTSIVTYYLARFEYKPVSSIPAVLTKPMLFWSRHSLQYYVIHRVILQAIGTFTGVLNSTLRLI